jgi:hypothetical protein
MATKQLKTSSKRAAISDRKAAPRATRSKPASGKSVIKDPVGRYMREHWGELGKDYKLEY